MPTPKQYADRAARQKAYRERMAQARQEEQEAKGLPSAPPIPSLPGTARWKALHAQAVAALETMQAEMQGYFDDRSEAWQEGDRGEAFRDRLDDVEAALDALNLIALE